jgi:hypothetical protein
VISPIYDGTSTEVIVASGGEASLLREKFLLPLIFYGVDYLVHAVQAQIIFMTSNMSWPFCLDLLVRMLVLLSTIQ